MVSLDHEAKATKRLNRMKHLKDVVHADTHPNTQGELELFIRTKVREIA